MKKQQGYYMVIPAEIWDATISAKAMVLYGHITVLVRKEKYCYATNSYFAKCMKLSTSTIGRCMKELEDNNFISRVNIYAEDTKEVKERRIYLTTGIVADEDRGIVADEDRGIVADEDRGIVVADEDNNTSNNNTSNNNIKYKKVFDYLLEKYPKHRINSKGPIQKYLSKRSDQELLLIAKNLNRYLKVAGDYVKNLRNYLEHEAWTEEWLKQEENKTKNNGIINNKSVGVKTFKSDYADI